MLLFYPVDKNFPTTESFSASVSFPLFGPESTGADSRNAGGDDEMFSDLIPFKNRPCRLRPPKKLFDIESILGILISFSKSDYKQTKFYALPISLNGVGQLHLAFATIGCRRSSFSCACLKIEAITAITHVALDYNTSFQKAPQCFFCSSGIYWRNVQWQ